MRDPMRDPQTHPAATACYRSLPGLSGQQCCYNTVGQLIEESPDIVSPATGRNADGTCKFCKLDWKFWGHVGIDYVPAKIKEFYDKCCKKD